MSDATESNAADSNAIAAATALRSVVLPIALVDGALCVAVREHGTLAASFGELGRGDAEPVLGLPGFGANPRVASQLVRGPGGPDGAGIVVTAVALARDLDPAAHLPGARWVPLIGAPSVRGDDDDANSPAVALGDALRDDDARALWHACRRALAALLPQAPICAAVGCRGTSARFTSAVQHQCYEVGAAAARAGYVLVTGGLSGVMQRAARGAAEAGGRTMGILPGTEKADANPYAQTVLPSGIGIARNYLMALACDVMVAVNGGRGTLEEICYALDFERRVLTWDSWEMDGAEPIDSIGACEVALAEVLGRRLVAHLFGDGDGDGDEASE